LKSLHDFFQQKLEKNRKKFFVPFHWITPMGVWQEVTMDSLNFAMPYPSTPSRRVTPEKALRAGSLQPSSTHLDTPRRTPMLPFHWIDPLHQTLAFRAP
jgi:hypothetical protein